MKTLFFFFSFLIISLTGFSQGFKPVKFDPIEKVLQTDNDTTYIINFWATWCKPCIEEIPYFDELMEKYSNQKFKVVLVSMDFESDVQKRLIPFLEKKKYKSEVWWFNEQKQNKFIEQIEKDWYGEIPFTVIKNGSSNKRFWKAGKWEKEELFKKVAEIL